MTTLRKLLEKQGYDWENGTLILQPVTEEAYSPGRAHGDEILKGYVADRNDPLLDVGFDAGYGAPQCPRFFARDNSKIYFPGQYDGSTWVETVIIDPMVYIDEPTPYPGG